MSTALGWVPARLVVRDRCPRLPEGVEIQNEEQMFIIRPSIRRSYGVTGALISWLASGFLLLGSLWFEG